MVYHVLGYQCDYLVCAFTWCTLSVSSDLNVLSQLVQLYNSVECFLEWRQRLDWNRKHFKKIGHWCRLLSASSTCIVRWSTNAPLLSALNPQMSHLYLSLRDSLALCLLRSVCRVKLLSHTSHTYGQVSACWWHWWRFNVPFEKKVLLQHQYRPCLEWRNSCCRSELLFLNACPHTLHKKGSIDLPVQQKNGKLENSWFDRYFWMKGIFVCVLYPLLLQCVLYHFFYFHCSFLL